MKQSYKRRIGKKGILPQFLLVAVFLFIFGIVLLFTHLIYTDINTDLSNDGVFSDSQESQDIMARGQTTINGFDFIFTMILALIGAAILISAFFINTHPIFFFLSLLAMIMVLVVGGILSNVFNDITSGAELANATATFTMTGFVMDKFPLFVLVLMAMAGIIFFAKVQGSRN